MSLYRLKGTSGPAISQAWSLEAHAVIGSEDGCEIRIDSETIAPRHAELNIADGEITLRLLEEGGEVHLNGESVRTARLASGDEIRIGGCRWLLQAPGLKPERVLTGEAVRRKAKLWPWLVAGGLSALALLAWRLGYIPF